MQQGFDFRDIIVFIGLLLAFLFGIPTSAQETSGGCQLINSPDYDGIYSSVVIRNQSFNIGDEIRFAVEGPAEFGNPQMIYLTYFDDANGITTILDAAPFPGEVSYTTDLPYYGQIILSTDVPANVTVTAECTGSQQSSSNQQQAEAEQSGETSAYVQSNQSQTITVNQGDQPQLVLQFGNDGSTTLRDVSMVCRIEGEARFTERVETHQVFTMVEHTSTEIRFSGLAELPPGQNFNVSVEVDPAESSSDVICELFAGSTSYDSRTQTVRLR